MLFLQSLIIFAFVTPVRFCGISMNALHFRSIAESLVAIISPDFINIESTVFAVLASPLKPISDRRRLVKPATSPLLLIWASYTTSTSATRVPSRNSNIILRAFPVRCDSLYFECFSIMSLNTPSSHSIRGSPLSIASTVFSTLNPSTNIFFPTSCSGLMIFDLMISASFSDMTDRKRSDLSALLS